MRTDKRVAGEGRMASRPQTLIRDEVVRELGQSVLMLALAGSSVGAALGMLAIAAHALGA